MLKQAQAAETEALRRSYLAITENWRRLAEQEEMKRQKKEGEASASPSGTCLYSGADPKAVTEVPALPD